MVLYMLLYMYSVHGTFFQHFMTFFLTVLQKKILLILDSDFNIKWPPHKGFNGNLIHVLYFYTTVTSIDMYTVQYMYIVILTFCYHFLIIASIHGV